MNLHKQYFRILKICLLYFYTFLNLCLYKNPSSNMVKLIKFQLRPEFFKTFPSHFKRNLNMGAGVEQRPWTPTVRRGKIAPEMTTPGPNAVILPTLVGTKVADSKKQTAPAFTFGSRHKHYDTSIGPGPAQYNVIGLGAKGNGTPPAHSLRSRPRPKTIFLTPAPGEYDIEKGKRMLKDTPPKYSFGLRPFTTKPGVSPAPNAYRPENVEVKHRSPKFTICARNP